MKTTRLTACSHWCRFGLLAAHALTFAFLLAGCTGVYVSRPIGDKPHVLTPTKWEGTWIGANDAIRVRVADAAAGKLEYITTRVDDGAFVSTITEFFIRESNDWLFATFVNKEEPGHCDWARIKLDDDQLVVWLPEKGAFRELVHGGKLKGQVRDKDVTLDPPTAEELKALTTGALGVPFKWDKPLVLRRLGH